MYALNLSCFAMKQITPCMQKPVCSTALEKDLLILQFYTQSSLVTVSESCHSNSRNTKPNSNYLPSTRFFIS